MTSIALSFPAASPVMGTDRPVSAEALEERELVLSAQAGDHTAFAGLVHRHQRRAYAVARSIVLSHDADELPETLSSPHRDPAEAGELRARLARALNTLGERQRAVIVLHDVEGYKHAEIGALLGIPEGTARSDLHHARAHLRRQLSNLRSEK